MYCLSKVAAICLIGSAPEGSSVSSHKWTPYSSVTSRAFTCSSAADLAFWSTDSKLEMVSNKACNKVCMSRAWEDNLNYCRTNLT